MPSRTDATRATRLVELATWVERARAFRGWDFASIPTRVLDAVPPWDYPAIVRERCAGRRSVLDLGTGGGELLATLRPSMPGRVVATEEWIVNAPIARDRLAHLSVPVVRAKSLQLPFGSASFDLVIDRHEELDPSEVDRVLSPGGEFLTQQVGRHEWTELGRFFPRMTDFGDLKAAYRRGFRRLGFEVEVAEAESHVAYPGLGEFVFMLAVAPWTIPEFDPARDLEALLSFEDSCATEAGLVVTECRFLLIARKLG